MKKLEWFRNEKEKEEEEAPLWEDSLLGTDMEEAPASPFEKDDKIRITMLGTTSVGKTAFLSGVYQCMISGHETDLYLAVDEQYNGDESYASIEGIAMVRTDGTTHPFPSGTNETKLYGLNLYGRDKKYCGFEFMDYRGALVNQMIPGKVREEDSEFLKAQLINSDCILLFLDGVKISQYQNVEERKLCCRMSLLNSIFTNVLKGWEHRYHVIVVLTKVDDECVDTADKKNNYEGLCRKAMEICGPLAELCESFCMIPVSAVGEGRCNTRKQKNGGETVWVSELKQDAIPAPVNIDLVILYACKRILEQKKETLDQQISRLMEKREELEALIKKKKFSTELKMQWELAGKEASDKMELKKELEANIRNIMQRKINDSEDYIYYERKRSNAEGQFL